MSDEHDHWFKHALGVDLGKAVKKIESAGSSAIDAGNTAGKAVEHAKAAAWDGTKKAYGATTGVYDKVAPNFNDANDALGKGVDAIEAASKEGNKKASKNAGKVPIVGGLLQASAFASDVTTEAVGGVVKGAGDIAAMGGNAFVHPVDSAQSLGEGALGIAEHVPTAPGLNTTVKGVHGLVDLARGKKDGEYGGNAKDLAKNLLLNTKQDPKNPGKRTNADIDFLAGMGGGTKAWKEKPVEAASRTLTNLAPMLAGDEGAGGKKPPPKGAPPVEGGPAASRPVDPFAKTQVDALGKTQVDVLGKSKVDPLGKTQDLSKTQDLGKTQVDLGKTQPGTPDKPSTTGGEPADLKPKPGQPVAQLQKTMQDAMADLKAADQAHTEAQGDWVRYRATKPNPGRGVVGDPSWDPAIEKQLKDEATRTEAQRDAAADRRDAAAKAYGDATGYRLDGNTWKKK